ncbi:MAG: penicillin-binding transpeptidase domain-containing protein [Patescibacteria group bacterium]
MEALSAARVQSWLAWFFRGTLLLGFLLLFGRLIELQIIKGGYFRNIAEGNRIRRVPIIAPRGKILARGGEVLVGNKEVKKVIKFSADTGYEKTSDLVGAAEDEVITEYQRDYKLGTDFAHVSGYLGEVSPDEAGKINPVCPEKGVRRAGSWVGRSGLEEEYECLLAGVDGEELIEVDTRGKKVRTLGKREPIPGGDIKTSINIGLQKKVASVMRGRQGAAIISEPKGEILALYSSPSFDPNLFVGKIDSQKVSQIINDKSLPLFDRAIGGQYHPGSVFKPIVAITALSEGKIDKDFVFNDEGQIVIDTPLGTFTYSNWYFNQYGKTEGQIGLVRAIARSTDTFFYKLGEFVGIDRLTTWAKLFGLGEGTGIDLPGEIGGLVPDPEWKKRVKGEAWFLGNTYHVAIGQGDLALTPIEVSQALSVIAAGGRLCSPQIAAEPTCKSLTIKKEYLELVKEGMVQACSPGGTGFTFFDFSPQVACKTGTAETNVDGKPHAWFVVFAPADFPEIVATVLIEKSGEGSRVAGPLAREVLDYWFHP